MDINNEVHFLTNVNKTPSFIVYDNKRESFFDVKLDFTERTDSSDSYAEEDRDRAILKAVLDKGLVEFIMKL